MSDFMAACLQYEVVPGDVDSNLSSVRKGIAELAGRGCRLIVLPEMWACAFPYSRMEKLAARTPEILDEMRQWSRTEGLVLVGSLPEADGDRVYNTSYVIDSNGELAGKYRKIHLFSLQHEDVHFGSGSAPLVCTTSVGRLGIMICYDLRFPELARKLALDGAEIICVSALWPVARIDHWSMFLRSRAVENQLFLIGCNGCGVEKHLKYGGMSAIHSPGGDTLAQGGSGPGEIFTTLKMQEIRKFRDLLTCFEDRVPEAYRGIAN